MRSLVRLALIASAIALPTTTPAASAENDPALVCLYWQSFQVTPGPPAVNVPLLIGADVNCTVRPVRPAVDATVAQIKQIIEEIETE